MVVLMLDNVGTHLKSTIPIPEAAEHFTRRSVSMLRS